MIPLYPIFRVEHMLNTSLTIPENADDKVTDPLIVMPTINGMPESPGRDLAMSGSAEKTFDLKIITQTEQLLADAIYPESDKEVVWEFFIEWARVLLSRLSGG